MPATDASSALDEQCCPKCGYALKGLSAGRCPECGVECTPDLLKRARSGARRRRWLIAFLAVALLLYAPHGWLLFIDHPWNDQCWLWLRLWPVLPGLPVTILTRHFWRLPDWAEFVSMGVFTIAILLLLTWIASRGRVALIIVIIVLAPASIWFGLVTHALFQL